MTFLSSLGKPYLMRRRLLELEGFIERAFEIAEVTDAARTIAAAAIIDRDEARTMLLNLKWERDGDVFRATATAAEMEMIQLIADKHYPSN